MSIRRKVALIVMSCGVLALVAGQTWSVSANGDYTLRGAYNARLGGRLIHATFSGEAEVSGTTLRGNADTSTNSSVIFNVELNKRPYPNFATRRTLTGKMISLYGSERSVYKVTAGTIVFKINSNNRIVYKGTFKAKGIRGAEQGAAVTGNLRGGKL